MAAVPEAVHKPPHGKWLVSLILDVRAIVILMILAAVCWVTCCWALVAQMTGSVLSLLVDHSEHPFPDALVPPSPHPS